MLNVDIKIPPLSTFQLKGMEVMMKVKNHWYKILVVFCVIIWCIQTFHLCTYIIKVYKKNVILFITFLYLKINYIFNLNITKSKYILARS